MLSPVRQVCPAMCNGGEFVDKSDALAMDEFTRPLNQGCAGRSKRDGMDQPRGVHQSGARWGDHHRGDSLKVTRGQPWGAGMSGVEGVVYA